jgi:hypothetical protein
MEEAGEKALTDDDAETSSLSEGVVTACGKK